ncbi:MAG: hypothetical protein ACXVXK_18655 [Blastococcus sp.]
MPRDAVATLDLPTILRFAELCLAALGEAREEIDALNVYPVPDGDTGTNLFLTFEAAATRCWTASTTAATATCVRRWPRSPGARCSAPAATPG